MMIALALALALAAEKPEWQLVGTDVDKTDVYIRTVDWERGNPRVRAGRAWVMMDSSRDRTVSWSKTKAMYVIDCVLETYRQVTVQITDPDGSQRTLGERKMEFAIPGSNMGRVVEAFCSEPEADAAPARLNRA